MLSVEGKVFLCAVFYGKWHKRFDLEIGKWTRDAEEVTEDPELKGQAEYLRTSFPLHISPTFRVGLL